MLWLELLPFVVEPMVTFESSMHTGRLLGSDFARCVLHALLEKMHASHFPRVTSKSWVDDVNQRAEGTRQKVVASILDAGFAFASGIV